MEVDLIGLMYRYNADRKTIAMLLFPQNNFPLPALRRVLDGRAELDAKQLTTLRKAFNCSYNELFGKTWRIDNSQKMLTLTKGEYTATYNPLCDVTSIMREGKVVWVDSNSPNKMSLSEFLLLMDEKIAEDKKKRLETV